MNTSFSCKLRLFFTLVVLAATTWSSSNATTLESLAVRHVLIPIIMEAEAAPFVEHLGLKLLEGFFPSQTPFLAYSGVHHQTKVTVITMGKDKAYDTGVDSVGTVPSALATFLALAKNDDAEDSTIDLVLNAGTCGGFSIKGAEIGDVFLTTGVANHDRRIPIPGFDTYGIGKLETIDPQQMAAVLGYKTGICTTGNSLDHTPRDDEMMKENDASVKDMEAASIAYVSKMNGIPYLGVKVVTDIVDGGIPAQEEFLQNLASAAKSLQKALPLVLDYVCDETNKNHEEL